MSFFGSSRFPKKTGICSLLHLGAAAFVGFDRRTSSHWSAIAGLPKNGTCDERRKSAARRFCQLSLNTNACNSAQRFGILRRSEVLRSR